MDTNTKPVVEGKIWVGLGYGLLFSMPMWAGIIKLIAMIW